MKKYIIFLLIGFIFTILFSQTITEIAEIVDNFNDYNGRQVTIQAVVVMGAGVLHSNILRAYVQDYSGKGIQIHNSSLNATINAAFVRGNMLQITGTVGIFDGMRQITSMTSYQVLDTGYQPPFVELSIREAQNHQVWDGSFVKVSGTVSSVANPVGGGRDVIVQDDTGDNIIIRVWETTGLDVSGFFVGLPLDVFGVIRIFQSRSQITPGYNADFVIMLTEPVIQNINITPERPFIDEEITISAEIMDYDGFIESISFHYRTEFHTGWIENNMTHIGNNVYRVSLPAFETYHENQEGNYLFRIVASDNDGNVVNSGDRRIFVSLRRPIISDVRFLNHPEEHEDLRISANIIDAFVGGRIIAAKVLYTLNFSTNVREVEMTNDNSNLWIAELNGQASGTAVNVSIWAENDSGLTTLLDKNDVGEPIRYVYPINNNTVSLRIQSKAYNIYEGESVEIGYFVKQGDIIIIRIYNSEGKLVSTPVNRITSASDGINFYNWDGRDNDFRLVEPGLYICHLEVKDMLSGAIRNSTAPIVVGTRLRRGR